MTSSNNCLHFSSSSPSTSSTPGPVLGRNDYPGFSHRGSVSSRPQSERSDSGVGMTTPRSASSQRGVLDEAAGGGNGGICVMAQARARLIFLYNYLFRFLRGDFIRDNKFIFYHLSKKFD